MKIKIKAKDKNDIAKIRALLSMQLSAMGIKNLVFIDNNKKR